VRQRELRQFAVLEGLDPRDRDYEQHRAGALSWPEFEHWQRQPPQLPLSAVVAALVEAGAAAPPRAGEAELVAAAPAELEPAAGPPDRLPPVRVALGAPLRVAAPSTPVGAERPPRAAPGTIGAVHDPRVASCVRLRADGRSGNGFYVRPRLVVTAADVVGTASVIDVTTSDGEEALGLVVLVDQIRGLAVVHVPRAGQPMAFAESAGLEPGRTARVIGLGADGRARSGSAVFEPAPAVGAIDEGIARAPRLKLDDGGESAAPGAVVVSENHVIGLLAGGEDGPMRGILPIDGLSQLLESETLAGLP
jgi:S1-C subfamily serine protease